VMECGRCMGRVGCGCILLLISCLSKMG
jgi:hypothetical protein